MVGPSCIPHGVSKSFATKAVNKLSKEQKDKFGITDTTESSAIEVVASLIERHVNAEPSQDKKDLMLNDVDGFVSDLDNYFSIVKVPEDRFEEAKQQHAETEQFLRKQEVGNLAFFQFKEDKESQNKATALEAALLQQDLLFKEGVSYFKEHYPSGRVASISLILREPQEEKGITAQQKTLDTLTKIREMSQMEIYHPSSKEKLWVSSPSEIPNGWRPTGNYKYNGKVIRAKGVTSVTNDGSYTGPVLAAPIGSSVDAVGRAVFNREGIEEGKHPLYNKDNSLKDPEKNKEELQEFINEKLKGLYTVQGLINLAKDFLKLEEQLKKKWGNDIKIITKEIGLFGQTEDGSWNVGYPDMIIVDGRGVIHTLDFKTSIMHDIKGYINIFHDEEENNWHTGKHYGQQVTRYNRMQESYGLPVDLDPYVILIDTWYDASDTIASREKGKRASYQDKGDVVGFIDDEGNLTMSLGEYAEKNPISRKELLLDETDKEILYMEPRLHINITEDSKGTITYSEELAALRDKKDIHFDNEASYEQQWETLTEEEKAEMQWLFNAKPVAFRTSQGIVTLSENDIESNPELITSQEIQDVADFMMYRVSRIITDLQKGKSYSEIPLSSPKGNESQSTVFLGKSRADIIKIAGIDNLINIAFKTIEERYSEDFPTEQEYKDENYDDLMYEFENDEDYQNQKRMNDKAKWLIDHKEQLIRMGNAKLISLENSIIPKKNESQEFNPSTPDTRMEAEDNEAIGETGDSESTQSFVDQYLEGITDVEAWMLGQRNYSPKASLAQEIKRMFEDIDMVDANGNPIMDSYGWGFSIPLDATYAIQTVLDTCKHCETIDEMIEALKDLARSPQNNWVNQVLDTINMKGNENLKKKFFRHFRKDALNYSIAQVKFDKKTGKRIVETKIINTKSAYDTITQSLSTSFRNGSVGAYTINGQTFSLVQKNIKGNNVLTPFGKGTVAGQIRKDAETWYKRLKQLYSEGKFKPEGVTAYVSEQIQKKQFDGKTIIQGLTEILNGAGIRVPQDVVLNACLSKVGKGPVTSIAGKLLNNTKEAMNKLETMNSKEGIPSGLSGNAAFRNYQPILSMLADSVQEYVEASVYQDGKTYYSYTNPSRIGHIIRNLTDALNDPSKFEKYIKDNFGRYTGWFKTVDGSEWLNDWVKQLAAEGSAARQALAHKVELSYIGNQYRNLGALGFQLSILHNYFGSRDDNSVNKDYRWFALPTMSNKPTNEFVRMLKYKNPDEIIDRVLIPTFQQEMNRMADVLFHFANYDDSVATDQIDLTEKKLKKAGWTQEEIDALKERINSQSITAQDMQRLASVTSGAKFHFLWYLNNDWNNEDIPEFGGRLAERLNILLTPEGEAKQSRLNASDEADTLSFVREIVAYHMEEIVESELDNMRKIGLFDIETKKINGKEVKVLKYQEEFNGRLGDGEHGYDNAVKEMEEKLKDFIWQDIAANINIIQITGGDLAYYGNAVNYQKRIAQIHSPGLKLMHDDEYDDGYLRSVHISDETVRDEIRTNTEVVLNEYMENSGLTGTAKEDYKKMISIILDGLTKTEATDGQSYSSPTSIRKKLALQGEWDEEKEKAYQAISRGDFNINHLGVMLQPSKPFVTSDMAKYSGSTTMELRRVPLQDKNSEYLIVLAEALARGAGKRSKLVAICDFMEATAKDNPKQGIDTAHFASVNKVGKSGIIDISTFDEEFNKKLQKGEVIEEDYNALLTEYMLYHVRTKRSSKQSIQSQDDFDESERLVSEGKLKREETLYNSQYVDTIPLDDYIIQQDVPAHLLEHQQLYGSQIRILGISDITPGTEFDVNGEKMSDDALVKEYKKLHAQNIRESFDDLMKELGLDKLAKEGEIRLETIDELPSDERNEVYRNIESLLQKELTKDAKYGLDMYRACTLQYDRDGNVIDFTVPLMDPIQSRRIQELINSIIKKSINKQRITGGPVVQTTAYDRNLHIRFKDKEGNLLMTFDEYGIKMAENWHLQGHTDTMPAERVLAQYKEYLRLNQAGIAYFECYMPIPNATLERLMTNPDGSMMSFEELKKKLPKEVFDSMMQAIGYRIPTEDKYSMIPLKIMGFVPKAAGQVIMMPQEITYLTGSDFDIDKMYIMLKSFRIAGDVSKRDRQGRDDINALINSYKDKVGAENTFPGIQKVVQQTIENANHILNGDEGYSWETGITKDTNYDKAKKFISWYKDRLFKTVFSEILYEPESLSKKEMRDGRNNRILDLQWTVLTNEDTASKMLNPGNFNDQKKVGRIIRLLKEGAYNQSTDETYTYEQLNAMTIEELDGLLENAEQHNTTLPSSKIYFQRQNMQGSQMVGIFANHNVSHAFMTFQKVGIDLQKDGKDNSFSFDGITIGDADNPIVLDPQKGFNGQLISKTIASFLAASVDTAKDPVLSDLNVNTFTGGVAMVLARLGFDTASIGLFLSQPVIMQLSDLYFKNSTDGFYKGDTAIEELASMLGMKKKDLQDTDGIKDSTLSKDNFIVHLTDDVSADSADDFQKRVLQGFYRLYQIAHDLSDLTFCTKFNSVSNAVGPTIADTMEDMDRVERFVNSGETNVFYIPESDNDPRGFTDPAEIIDNDAILSAFYETTVASDGASDRIFRNFFPHYYAGFQNVRDYFKENFLGGKKINSKLYNQLLNEYIYYLMTYQDENYSPTVPYSTQDKKRLVNNLISDFQEVLKIRDRKPNAILDQGLGNNCLRVRGADEFLAVDTLIFNNSQLNAEGQQKIRNAWTDLITMNDPNLSEEDNMRIRSFGIDLFFYNLMRNGFTFSPKTMMTLASVVVRYNANYNEEKGFQNYIEGLRNLKDIDGFLMNGADNMSAIKRFCGQFIRNHANNGQLIPKIDIMDKKFDASVDTKTNELELKAPEGKETNLAKIMVAQDTPSPFINVITKSGKTITQELYELVENVDGTKVSTDGHGGIAVRYKKSNRLGLTNNFIEYDANSPLETSYFEDIRNASENDMDEETPTEGQSKDEQEKNTGMSTPDNDGSFTSFWNSNVLPILTSLKGPQAGKEGRDYRLKLKKAMQKADDNSEFAKAFNTMLEAKQEDRQGLMDKINDIFKNQNSCFKG